MRLIVLPVLINFALPPISLYLLNNHAFPETYKTAINVLEEVIAFEQDTLCCVSNAFFQGEIKENYVQNSFKLVIII